MDADVENLQHPTGSVKDNESLTEIATCLLSVVIRSIQIRDQILMNVLEFVHGVVSTPADQNELTQYICAMLLFLWKQNYALQPLLDGLQKQSITSLHTYLCPDLHVSSAENGPIQHEPYKDATERLKQLSEMKPRKCSACHKESIFQYTFVQRLSADEGMTAIVTCNHCGKRQRY